MMVLCTGLFFGCDKEQDEYEPIKPPIEQPEEPNEPVSSPSTNDIISFKIGDTSMIIEQIHGMELSMGMEDMQS